MSGDPTNARLWADADVYVAFDPNNAPNPADADTPFGSEWDLVGLLDGEEGFNESREEEVNDHFAWGGILMRTSRRNFKLMKSFTAFEHTEVTRKLRWPGSEPGEIVVPRPTRVKVAFETREAGIVRRLITRYQAEVSLDGDVSENEADPASLPFMVTFYPDANGVLLDEQNTEPASA